MPSSFNNILKAIRTLLANKTPENARALADVAGLTLEQDFTLSNSNTTPTHNIKDIEKIIKKWSEIKKVARSNIIDRLKQGWFIENKKTGVASRYVFTNGDEYIVKSKKNDSQKMYEFIYLAMNTFGDLQKALNVSGVLNRISKDEKDSLIAKIKENYKQGRIDKDTYNWHNGIVYDAYFEYGEPSTVQAAKKLALEYGENNHFDDIGGFTFTPAIDFDGTLKAIKAVLANNTPENAKRLAALAGLTLKEDAPEVELDIFGDPIQNHGFDLFGDPIQDGEESPVEELPRLAVVELPLSKLSLSEDVPQFKSGADDESGVVEALGGKFDRTGVAPIQVWERTDGRLEIISGRHRTDLARRSGEKTIPAQVHKESEGFTAKQAMMLDAELNIRDGQGKVKDYVDYFTHSEISEDEADKRGLLARSIGQRAFMIASKGSEELKTLHRNEIISDQAASDIANLAPNNGAMQAVGLRVLQEHKPLNNALNTIRAVMALTREKGQEPDTFDLFGFDDSALKEAEAMAKIASRKQRQIAEQLTAIKGAVKNPKLAAKHGVIVANEADALAKVQAMTTQKARWDNWSSHADLLAEVRSELNDKLDSIDFDETDYYWFCNEELELITV